MTIRPAQAGDYSQIYSLVQTAFATAKVSDGTEQDFVLELRRRDTYRPELELVSEEDGQLIINVVRFDNVIYLYDNENVLKAYLDGDGIHLLNGASFGGALPGDFNNRVKDFFNDEHGPAQRCPEGRGQAAGRPGCQEDPGVAFRGLEPLGHPLADR